MKPSILILCTGNSCRSQMAEGFLRSFDKNIEVFSAGTSPSDVVHPKAIEVMGEIGIDISDGYPKHVDEFINKEFEYVITVCGDANENCPVFTGEVKNRLHIGFEDPAKATGSKDKILFVFRKVRDEINKEFKSFYKQYIQQ